MYAPGCEFWKLRTLVAGFSVAATALMYPIARRMGASPAGAALAVALETFSLLHAVEARLVLLNTQLLFWLNATLYGGLRWFARANAAARAGAPPMLLGERLAWAVGVGVLAGNALSVKHTGLATPALVGLEAACGLFFLARPLFVLDLAAYVFTMAATYTLYFWVHLSNIAHAHLSLHQEEEFMSAEDQSLLPGSRTFNPAARPTEGFWRTFVTLNRRMVVHSAAITQPHAWGTRPFDWIFNLRGVSYWGSTNGEQGAETAAVYLFGNPISQLAVFGALLVLVAAAGVAARTAAHADGTLMLLDEFRRAWEPRRAAAALCLAGWVTNLLPYAAIERTCFAYHYMPALVYGHLLLALLVDAFAGWPGAAAMAAAAAAAFGYWAPWVYALPLSFEAHSRRRWLEKWN